MVIVKELDALEAHGDARMRRLVIVRRTDGNFAYAEQYYYVSEHEGAAISEGWSTLHVFGVYASAELAEAEGKAAFPHWYGTR